MQSKLLDIEKARLLVEHETVLRARVIRARRGTECAVLLWKSVEADGKTFVVFYELKLANELRPRIFKSLNAAANALLNGIGLRLFVVTDMTLERTKEHILKDLGAEERK